MSDITGEGYGDQHDWEKGETNAEYYSLDRATLFRCRKCHITHRHFYNATPDIFTSMKEKRIPEECIEVKDGAE